MSEFESQPKVDRLIGTHVELDVINPDVIREQLSKSDYISLNSSYGSILPYPLETAWVSLQHTSDIDMPSAPYAHINFTPPKEYSEAWHELVRNELFAQLINNEPNRKMTHSDDIIEVPHEPNAVYVRISRDYYARVELTSTLKNCQIIIDVEHTNEIEDAIGHEIDDKTHTDDIDAYQRLVAFAYVWIKAMDSVASVYSLESKVFKKHQLQLTVPKIVQEQKEASQQPVTTEVTQIPDIEKAIKSEKSFDMIGGLTEAKTKLQEIVFAHKDPEGAAMYGFYGSHFILHGPPGTGKTSLIEAFANELGAQIYRIPSTKILVALLGQSATNVDNVFQELKDLSEYGVVVAVADEIDALVGTRGQRHRENINAVKRFNENISDISEDPQYRGKIIIAGATNVDIEDLEPSIVRSGRMEMISAPLPNEKDRRDIWASVLWKEYLAFQATTPDIQKFLPYGDDIMTHELAQHSSQLTGADFKEIIVNARKKQYSLYRQTGIAGVVMQSDLLEGIKELKAKQQNQ